jgi:hypothetical protein
MARQIQEVPESGRIAPERSSAGSAAPVGSRYSQK